METGKIIGGIAVAAILLGVLMAVMGPGTKFGTGWQYLTSGQSAGSLQSNSPGVSVLGSPSLSAAKIDAILANAGSPAAGSGATFYADSQQYGIDDAYALAWFQHESSFGTSGAATQTHSIGNIVCTAGYSCMGRFRAYPSWAEGIDDWYRLVAGPAYVGGGLSTVESIIPKYAPASDNNDPQSYIAAVERDVQNWRQS